MSGNQPGKGAFTPGHLPNESDTFDHLACVDGPLDVGRTFTGGNVGEKGALPHKRLRTTAQIQPLAWLKRT